MAAIGDWLDLMLGCRHRHTTLPLTIRTQPGDVTYMVCLDCGDEIPYDWGAMRRGRPGKAQAPGQRGPVTAKALPG